MQNTPPSPNPITPVRRRRRFTVEQKQALLDLATLPGNSISSVAREHDIAPSQMFQWKKAMANGSKERLKANERVVPESELKEAQKKIRELERLLGKKVVENEILQEAVKIARKKSGSRATALQTRAGGSEAYRRNAWNCSFKSLPPAKTRYREIFETVSAGSNARSGDSLGR